MTGGPGKPGAASAGGRFVPPAGKTLLLVGQDVKTIEEYLSQVDPRPAGFMIYTSTKHAWGLSGPINLGAGTCHGAHFTNDRKYDHTVLQIGLYMVDDLDEVIGGKRAAQIDKIAQWVKATRRPVYLRIGYEFDGAWNHYEPDKYVKAYRAIVDRFRDLGVRNVAYVWSSSAAPPYKHHPLSAWYPGDDYVDWVGISVFRQFDAALGTEADLLRVIAFAKARDKPVGIVESTPYGSKGGIPDAKWDGWFKKVFRLIEDHDIRMFCYINTNWDSQSMWRGQGWGDCRLQTNETVLKNWLRETGKDRYLKSSDQLFEILQFER